MCKVSVIIPCYNDGAQLAPTLNDVLNQTLRDIEIILVDDGSTDSTVEIIKSLAANDQRVKCLLFMENRGPLQSRIAALSRARGQYVVFYDCGDRIEPSVLRDYMGVAEADGADIVIGGYTMEIPTFHWRRGVQDCAGSSEETLRRLISNDGVSATHFAKLYRRSLLRCWEHVSIGGKVAEDLYLNIIAFANAGSFSNVRNTGYHWIYSGMGKKYYMERWSEYAHMMVNIRELLQTLRPENPALCEDLSRRVEDAAKERLCWIWIYDFSSGNVRRAAEECVILLNKLGRKIVSEELVKRAKQHLRRHLKYFLFFRLAALLK